MKACHRMGCKTRLLPPMHLLDHPVPPAAQGASHVSHTSHQILRLPWAVLSLACHRSEVGHVSCAAAVSHMWGQVAHSKPQLCPSLSV